MATERQLSAAELSFMLKESEKKTKPLEDEVESSKKLISSLNAGIDNLQKDVIARERDIRGLQNNVEILKEKIANLESGEMIPLLKKEIEELESKNKELEEKDDREEELQSDLSDAESEVSELESKVEDLEEVEERFYDLIDNPGSLYSIETMWLRMRYEVKAAQRLYAEGKIENLFMPTSKVEINNMVSS